MVYQFIEILFILKNGGKSEICDNMDGPWEHYAKWNKQSQKDKYYMILMIQGI